MFVAVRGILSKKDKIVEDSDILEFNVNKWSLSLKYTLVSSGEIVQILFVDDKKDVVEKKIQTGRIKAMPARLLDTASENEQTFPPKKQKKSNEDYEALTANKLDSIRQRMRSRRNTIESSESEEEEDSANNQVAKHQVKNHPSQSEVLKPKIISNLPHQTKLKLRNTGSDVLNSSHQHQKLVERIVSQQNVEELEVKVSHLETTNEKLVARVAVLETSLEERNAEIEVQKNKLETLKMSSNNVISKLSNDIFERDEIIKQLNEENEEYVKKLQDKKESGTTNTNQLTTSSVVLVKKKTDDAVGTVNADGYIYMGHDRWMPNNIYEAASHDFPSPAVFVNNIAVAVFGIDGLSNSTVTGQPSNRKKKQIPANAPTMKKLCPMTVLSIRSLLKYFMRSKFSISEEDVLNFADRTKFYLSRKASAVKSVSTKSKKTLTFKTNKRDRDQTDDLDDSANNNQGSQEIDQTEEQFNGTLENANSIVVDIDVVDGGSFNDTGIENSRDSLTMEDQGSSVETELNELENSNGSKENDDINNNSSEAAD